MRIVIPALWGSFLLLIHLKQASHSVTPHRSVRYTQARPVTPEDRKNTRYKIPVQYRILAVLCSRNRAHPRSAIFCYRYLDNYCGSLEEVESFSIWSNVFWSCRRALKSSHTVWRICAFVAHVRRVSPGPYLRPRKNERVNEGPGRRRSFASAP